MSDGPWPSSAVAIRLAQAALFLARTCRTLSNSSSASGDLTASMSRYLIDQLERIPNVRIMLVAEVRELLGDDTAGGGGRGGRTRDGRTKVSLAAWCCSSLSASGPVQRLARRPGRPGRPRLRPDRPGHGELRAGDEPAGIFAVGDVRSGSAKRVAAAVGEGAMAIRLAFEKTRPGIACGSPEERHNDSRYVAGRRRRARPCRPALGLDDDLSGSYRCWPASRCWPGRAGR